MTDALKTALREVWIDHRDVEPSREVLDTWTEALTRRGVGVVGDGQRTLRTEKPVGETFDEMRANFRKTDLYQKGDALLVWVNEGDLLLATAFHQLAPTPPRSDVEAVAPVRKPDREMTEFLAGVVGVVEANSFEKHMLWTENRQRGKPKTWIENNAGLGETVGHLADMPVFVSLFTAEIDGFKVLFIGPTSQVVDHRMVEKWLIDTLPKSAFRDDGYVNKTNAMNFHNVFPRHVTIGAEP